MSYTLADIPALGKATMRSLILLLINNQDDIEGRLDSVEGDTLPDGSFESGSSTPSTSWDTTTGTGGTITLSTTNPGHGAQRLSIARALGAGNSGGYVTSAGFIPVAQGEYKIELLYRSDAAINSKVALLWYDEDENLLSNTVHTLTAWATAERRVLFTGTIEDGARFAKVRLTGADDTVDLAANVGFDGVLFSQTQYTEPSEQFDSTTHAFDAGSDNWDDDIHSITIWIPPDADTMEITGEIREVNNFGTAKWRFNVGTATSNISAAVTYSAWAAETLTLTIPEANKGTLATVSFDGYTFVAEAAGQLRLVSSSSNGREQNIEILE